MPGSYADAYAKCPFYQYSDSKQLRIVCEGYTSQASVTTRFRYSSRQAKYLRRYCCDNYKQCRLYKAIEAKYEERPNDEEEN